MAPRTAPPPRRPAPAARSTARRAPAPSRRPVRQQKNLLNYPRAGARAPWRWLPSLRLLVVGFLLGVVGVVGAGALAYASVDIPTEEAEGVNYRTSTVLYADGSEMADFAKDGVNRVPLPEGPDGTPQVPANVANAIIAAEDRTFRENRGISVTGLARAVYGVVTDRDLGGGSTITQQYVKNIYGDDAPTYARKAREAIIALKLDQRLTKDEILARYLDTIYFGRGAYGVQTAADVYFGKPAADLSVPEAALLVGIVPAPSAWDPRNDPERAQERYAYVMNSMVETGSLSAGEAAAAAVMPVTLEPTVGNTYGGPNGHVLVAVREELKTKGFTEEEIDTGGLSIQTTIDPRLQQAAIDAMRDPEVYPTEGRPPTVQSGLVSIDPASGGVRAMYGGDDYLVRQVNSVTQGTAQAGSTFKPFTLVAALEADWSLRDTLDGSSPRTFREYLDEDEDPVPVRNFGGRSAGTVDLVEATANSVNTAYVELNLDVGPEKTKAVAERAGLPNDQEAADLGLEPIPAVPSNVLGTATVRPIDMAEAFATFAAQGIHREPHFVSQVTRIADGEVQYTVDPRADQVFEAGVMADATVAMQAVVEEGSAERYASQLDRPAAGKTGTTQSNRAAWFSGYTPELATTVVLYNVADGSDPAVPVNTQLELPGFGGRDETTGGSWPSAIWTRYMQTALDDVDAEVIEFPEGTRQRRSTPSASSSTESPTESPSEEPTPTEEPTETPTAEPTEPTPSDEGDAEGEGDGGEEPTPSESDPAPEDQAAGGRGNGNGNSGGNGNGNG